MEVDGNVPSAQGQQTPIRPAGRRYPRHRMNMLGRLAICRANIRLARSNSLTDLAKNRCTLQGQIPTG